MVLGASGDLAKKKTVIPIQLRLFPVVVLTAPAVPGTLRPRTRTPTAPPYRTILTTPQYRNNFLPKDVKIVGYARTKMDHAEYIKRVKSNIKTPNKDMEDQLAKFVEICTYVSGQYDEDDSFVNLRKHLEELEGDRKENNRIFYMALPPSVFIPVSQHLKKICYPKNGITRIIVCTMG